MKYADDSKFIDSTHDEFELKIFKDDKYIEKKSTHYILLSVAFAIGYLLYAKYYLFIYKYPNISEVGYRIGLFLYPYLGLVLLNTILLYNSLKIELSQNSEMNILLSNLIAIVLLPILYIESTVMSLWVFFRNAFD